jgi:septal ring factor EnvC (AmiA/AmiB activator)
MKLPLLFALMMLLTPLPAWAEAPLPPKKESLQTLKQKVEAEKAREKELASKAKTLEKDLSTIKSDLVSTATKVQKNEKTLQNLEQQMAELKKKKIQMSASLESDKESLSSLIIALERIRRLPPETLIARPGAPRETAQAATALSSILPELNRRAEDLRTKLDELSAVEEQLSDSQIELKATFEKLKSEKAKMDGLMQSRAKTYAETQHDMKSQQRAVEAASKEAQNFEELIRSIEEQNRQLAQRTSPSAKPPKAKEKKVDEQKLAATLPTLGSGQLPVSGIVRTRFGEEDEIGASSQGIRIDARSGAVVVAPLGGVVRYAGSFKSYGNIILLEHKNNYHSLIAGLSKIDTVIGQSVDSGEPVGTLGTQSGVRPSLYYELRLNGQPINPARKFTNLGS